MPIGLDTGDRIPMSWDEYERLEPGVPGEYIDGSLVASPSPTGRHQDIAFNITDALKRALPVSVRAREAWAWKPGNDEFVPDVMVFDDTDEQIRYTGHPHLVVEVLSSDRAADMIRKAHKYAEAGLEHYWIIDPEGPLIIEHRLVDGILVESARHRPGTEATLDVGVATLSIDPAELIR